MECEECKNFNGYNEDGTENCKAGRCVFNDDDPHCGNCRHWKDEGELFAICENQMNVNAYGECPYFAICELWEAIPND